MVLIPWVLLLKKVIVLGVIFSAARMHLKTVGSGPTTLTPQDKKSLLNTRKKPQ